MIKSEIKLRTYIRNIILEELDEEKKKGADGKACWDGYRFAGTENGKDKCVKVNEEDIEDSETVDGDIKDAGEALDQLSADIKAADFEGDENEAVGILTLAGIALSLPEITRLIGKFVNLLKKIPGLKKLNGDRLIELGEKYHHKITGAFAYTLKRAGVPDDKAKKFAFILHHLIVAILLVAGGLESMRYATSGQTSSATLKAAINAVKANEVRAFLITMASKVV